MRNDASPWVIRIALGHLCSAKVLIQKAAVKGQMSQKPVNDEVTKKKKKMTQPSKELTNIIFGKFEDSRGLYYTPVS